MNALEFLFGEMGSSEASCVSQMTWVFLVGGQIAHLLPQSQACGQSVTSW